MASKNMPYLHEVEYIRFSGGNWFNTGYIPVRLPKLSYLEVKCRTCPDFVTRIQDRTTTSYKSMFAFASRHSKTFNYAMGLGFVYGDVFVEPEGINYAINYSRSRINVPNSYGLAPTNGMVKIALRNRSTYFDFMVNDVTKYSNGAVTAPDAFTSPFYIGASAAGASGETPADYSFIGDICEASFGSYTSTKDIIRTWYPVIDKMGRIAFYEKYTKELIYPVTNKPLSVGPIVHTHDSEFTDADGTRLGSIPGDTLVLTGDDASYSYKIVDELPSAYNSDSKVVILSKAQAGFAEGQVLLATKTSAGWGWKAVSTPTSGVGVPTAIKSHKIGNKVVIRWDDPDDVLDGTGVKIIRKWKKTRLVRKLGSVPTGPYDGAIRCESTVRNYYSDRTFVDILPSNINTESQWFYKLFAYSEDGVVSTSSKCQFTPLEFDWTKMSSYIQSNKATSIFGVGDVIELDYEGFTGDDAIYNNLRLQVAGFDLITPTATKYNHSVTLIGYNVLTNLQMDEAWGNYRRVKNEIASGDKTYYEKVSGAYQVADPQPTPGVQLTEASGYYTLVTDGRRTTGSNQWSETRLREWLNAVTDSIYVLTSDTSPVSGKTYYTLNSDGSYSAVPTPTPDKNPRNLGWYQVKEARTFLTTLKPPLLAFKQMSTDENLTGFYDCIISANVKTTLNKKIRTASSVVEVTDDRVYIPSITQLTGDYNDGNNEGTHFPLFAANSDRIRWRAGYTSINPTAWWSRSPYITDTSTDMTNLDYVTTTGEMAFTTSPLDVKGVLFAITIG